MNPRTIITVLGGLWLAHIAAFSGPTPDQMQALVKSRPELDEIRWKDPARGAPLKVRIIQASGANLTVEKALPTGITVRNIPMVELSGMTIQFTPREAALHSQPAAASIPPLRVYWETRRDTLRLSGSNAGETGLALATALRISGGATELAEAGEILDLVRSKGAVKSLVERARQEQSTLDLARMIKGGDFAEAEKVAWKITEDNGNTDGMLLATGYLADRSFSELKKTEAENPRWIEDEEIKPLRDNLYHLALDFSLYPSVFLGTRQEEAAAGLKKAAEIHLFAGEKLLAKNALDDLASLYPGASSTAASAPMLEELKRDAGGKETAPAGPTTEPVEPGKKYNIFGD